MVTLNRSGDIDPNRVLRTVTYEHPIYSPAGVVAQRRRHEVSGIDRYLFLRCLLAQRIP